jgi:hypothetical protein
VPDFKAQQQSFEEQKIVIPVSVARLSWPLTARRMAKLLGGVMR